MESRHEQWTRESEEHSTTINTQKLINMELENKQLRTRNAELEADVEHLKSEIQLIITPPEAVGRVVHELKAEVERLRKILETAPIKLLNETDHKFLLRYKQWYRNYKAALEASDIPVPNISGCGEEDGFTKEASDG